MLVKVVDFEKGDFVQEFFDFGNVEKMVVVIEVYFVLGKMWSIGYFIGLKIFN